MGYHDEFSHSRSNSMQMHEEKKQTDPQAVTITTDGDNNTSIMP